MNHLDNWQSANRTLTLLASRFMISVSCHNRHYFSSYFGGRVAWVSGNERDTTNQPLADVVCPFYPSPIFLFFLKLQPTDVTQSHWRRGLVFRIENSPAESMMMFPANSILSARIAWITDSQEAGCGRLIGHTQYVLRYPR